MPLKNRQPYDRQENKQLERQAYVRAIERQPDPRATQLTRTTQRLILQHGVNDVLQVLGRSMVTLDHQTAQALRAELVRNGDDLFEAVRRILVEEEPED